MGSEAWISATLLPFPIPASFLVRMCKAHGKCSCFLEKEGKEGLGSSDVKASLGSRGTQGFSGPSSAPVTLSAQAGEAWAFSSPLLPPILLSWLDCSPTKGMLLSSAQGTKRLQTHILHLDCSWLTLGLRGFRMSLELIPHEPGVVSPQTGQDGEQKWVRPPSPRQRPTFPHCWVPAFAGARGAWPCFTPPGLLLPPGSALAWPVPAAPFSATLCGVLSCSGPT